MAIKRYTAIADTTISNAFKSNLLNRASNSNMGESDILETFSIFAQSTTSSLERILCWTSSILLSSGAHKQWRLSMRSIKVEESTL